MASPDRQAPLAAAVQQTAQSVTSYSEGEGHPLGAVPLPCPVSGARDNNDTVASSIAPASSSTTNEPLSSLSRRQDDSEGITLNEPDGIRLRTLPMINTASHTKLPEIHITAASPIDSRQSLEAEQRFRRIYPSSSDDQAQAPTQTDGAVSSVPVTVPTTFEQMVEKSKQEHKDRMTRGNAAGAGAAPEMSTTAGQQPYNNLCAIPLPSDTPEPAKPEAAHLAHTTSSSSDAPELTTTPSAKEKAASLSISLLLPTGVRHSFRITEHYLTKRNISIPGSTSDGKKDPYSISIYQLKELILREWKDEWTPRPPPRPRDSTEGGAGSRASGDVEAEAEDTKPQSPGAIRLIFFGRLLEDGASLGDCRFNAQTANILHMAIRPNDVVEEEESERKRNERGVREEREERTPGCRCAVM